MSQSVAAPSVTLVLGLTGIVHRHGCRVMGRAYKVVAPEITEAEVAAFLEARQFVACRNCLGLLTTPQRGRGLTK